MEKFLFDVCALLYGDLLLDCAPVNVLEAFRKHILSCF